MSECRSIGACARGAGAAGVADAAWPGVCAQVGLELVEHINFHDYFERCTTMSAPPPLPPDARFAHTLSAVPPRPPCLFLHRARCTPYPQPRRRAQRR